MHKTLLASVGGVAAALLGSLCCVGPLLFVTLGVGAGLVSTFGPLRPLFGVLMVAMLGLGFYTVYGSPRARDKLLLWGAVVLALILWTFPTWSTLFV